MVEKVTSVVIALNACAAAPKAVRFNGREASIPSAEIRQQNALPERFG